MQVTFAPMKKLLAIFTLIAMVAQTFHKGIIEADFFINREQIAEQLCENKGKPELHCKGHCQLKKELEKKNEPQAQQQLSEMSVFLVAPVVQLEKRNCIPGQQFYPNSHSFCSQVYLADIFHPPGSLMNV